MTEGAPGREYSSKVGEGSPELHKARELLRSSYLAEDSGAFGERELAQYLYVDKLMQAPGGDTEFHRSHQESLVENLKVKIMDALEEGRERDIAATVGLFVDAWQDPKVGPALKKHVRRKSFAQRKTNVSRRMLMDLYARGTKADLLANNVADLPDDVLIDVVKVHRDQHEIRNNIWRVERLPKLHEAFLERLSRAIDSKRLPLGKEIATQRLNDIRVNLFDGLAASFWDAWGTFQHGTRSVLISASVPVDHLENTYSHELMHALEGVSAQVMGGDFGVVRSGLTLNLATRWLNEAVTEDLTSSIILEAPSKTYQDERTIFDAVTKYVPRELFYGAYFESYDPNVPVTERIPRWKELSRKVNGVFGPGFLTKIGQRIQGNLFAGGKIDVAAQLAYIEERAKRGKQT